MDGLGLTARSPLVGRTRELDILGQSLRAAAAGDARTVILSGEAGIGKSRLAAETIAGALKANFVVARGACYEQDRAFPYAPWAEALRSTAAGPAAMEARALLTERAQAFAGLLPELESSRSQAAVPPLEPEAEKRRLFEAAAGFMSRLAAARPLLLVLEDLHWSDESSLDLLLFVARRLAGQRAMLLLTYRSDDVSAPLRRLLAEFDRGGRSLELGLPPLTRDETATLAQARLGSGGRVAGDFVDFIAALTDGNPFFIEEVLKWGFADDGAVNRLERERAAGASVPRSVQEALWQRLPGLSEGAQRLIRWAAVVGRRVDFDLVGTLMPVDESHLLACVRELIDAGLMVEASADELAFRHALTREAVYATLLARERRGLHRQVLAAMEDRYASSLDPHAGELAYHAYEGEEWTRAMSYSRRAGEQARALYATHEALVHFSRAVDAAGRTNLEPPPDLLAARGRLYEHLGEFEPARGDYERALAGARAAGDPAAEWQALLDLGFLWSARDYDRSGLYLQDALALSYRLEDPASAAHSLNRLGNWHFNQMRLGEALPLYGQALDTFRDLGDRLGVAETLDLLGIAKFTEGDIIAGCAYFEEAIGLFREIGNKRRLAQSLVMLPLAYRFNTEILGSIEPAALLAAGEEGLRLAREIGWRAGELQAHARQMQYAREAGDYGQALAAEKSAFAIAEDIGHLGFLAAGHWGKGDLCLDLFDVEEAGPHVELACALARESGSGIWRHHSAMVLARLSIRQGAWARAEVALGPRRSALPENGMPTQDRENWAMWAEMLLARHDAADALAVVDRLIDRALNAGQFGRRAIPRFSLMRGQALRAMARYDEAEEELRAAWEVGTSQGKRPLLWQIAAERGRAAQAQGRRVEAQQQFAAAARLIEELANDIPDEALRSKFVQGAKAGLPRPRPPTTRRAASQAFGGLSEREREVAALIATGRSNRQIAETLVLSERTVDRHVANIMVKLGHNSRAQIAAWAAERGLRANIES